MAKRKKLTLTEEWLRNWHPRRIEELADAGCKGLSIRGGPSGTKTFHRWEQVRDCETGKAVRRRVKLGYFPSLSLADAQAKVHAAREAQRAEVPGAAKTVEEIAEQYRKDVIANRERADEAWAIIRTHVVEARADPKRPPFGQWMAREVRPRWTGEIRPTADGSKPANGRDPRPVRFYPAASSFCNA